MPDNTGKAGSSRDEHLMEAIRRLHRREGRYYEALQPPCPLDGEDMEYVGLTRSPAQLGVVFRCPDGHMVLYPDWAVAPRYYRSPEAHGQGRLLDAEQQRMWIVPKEKLETEAG